MLDSSIIPLIITMTPNQAKVPNVIYKYAWANGKHGKDHLSGVLTTGLAIDPLYLFWMTDEELVRVNGVGRGDIPFLAITRETPVPRYVKINVTRRQYVFATDETDCIHFPSRMELFASLGQVTHTINKKKKAAQ